MKKVLSLMSLLKEGKGFRAWQSPDLLPWVPWCSLRKASAHCSIHLHKEAAAILLSFSSSLKTLIKISNKTPLAPGLLGDYPAITNTIQVGRLHRAGSNPLSQLLNRD